MSSYPSAAGLSKRTAAQPPLYPYHPSPSSKPLYPAAPYAPGDSRTATPPSAGYSTGRSLDGLESQGEERLEGLIGKVRLLKDITVHIGSEVKDGTLEMESMNDIFASTSSFLKGNMRRMGTMSRNVGGQWCALMLFLVLCGWLFVGLWWWRR